MTECPYCKKEYKNLGVHERYCKAKPSELHPIEEIKEHLEGLKEPKKESFLARFWKKKSKEIIEVKSPQELIEGMPSYKIPETNPKTGLGKIFNKNKDFIQVVLVSEIIEPKTFWVEKTSMNRIQYKDRMFKLPRDIRGNVFFWHIDKKEPLIDTARANESDAESSFHELQLANMYYSIGRAAGANDLLNNLKLILMIVGFGILLSVAILIYLNQIQKGIQADNQQILNTLYYINQSIGR